MKNDGVALQISNMVRDAIKPDMTMFLHYETISENGKHVVLVDVQRGTERPYYIAKKGLRPEGVYVRQGYSSVPATDTAIRKMIKQLNDVYAYLDRYNQTKATFHKLLRIDTRDYPEVALREALLNLIVHRDYAFSASALISVYSDRMEFVSIGGLMPGIELDDVMLGISVCRNQNLANVFYRLQLIEAYGTGIRKILNAYENSARKPVIENTGNAFKIILPNFNADGVEKEKNGLSDEEKTIIELVQAQKSVTRKDVEQVLGCSSSTAIRFLSNMVQKDVLLREGKTNGTRYKLKN